MSTTKAERRAASAAQHKCERCGNCTREGARLCGRCEEIESADHEEKHRYELRETLQTELVNAVADLCDKAGNYDRADRLRGIVLALELAG